MHALKNQSKATKVHLCLSLSHIMIILMLSEQWLHSAVTLTRGGRLLSELVKVGAGVVMFQYQVNLQTPLLKRGDIKSTQLRSAGGFCTGRTKLAAREIVNGRHLTHRPAINSSRSAFVTPQQCMMEGGEERRGGGRHGGDGWR